MRFQSLAAYILVAAHRGHSADSAANGSSDQNAVITLADEALDHEFRQQLYLLSRLRDLKRGNERLLPEEMFSNANFYNHMVGSGELERALLYPEALDLSSLSLAEIPSRPLRYMRNVKQVRLLSLNPQHLDVNSALFQNLSTLGCHVDLMLEDMNINVSLLSSIISALNLVRLHLCGVGVSSCNGERIPDAPKAVSIKSLDVATCSFDEPSLRYMLALPNIKTLILRGLNSLSFLRAASAHHAFPQLTTLLAANIQLRGPDLAYLTFPALDRVILDENPIAADFSGFGDILTKSVTWLNLRCVELTDSVVEALGKFQKLETLDASESNMGELLDNITKDTPIDLMNLKKTLRTFTGRRIGLTLKGLRWISSQVEVLDALHIPQNDGLHNLDENFKFHESLFTVTSLDLGRCGLGLRALVPIFSLPRLDKVNLSSNHILGIELSGGRFGLPVNPGAGLASSACGTASNPAPPRRIFTNIKKMAPKSLGELYLENLGLRFSGLKFVLSLFKDLGRLDCDMNPFLFSEITSSDPDAKPWILNLEQLSVRGCLASADKIAFVQSFLPNTRIETEWQSTTILPKGFRAGRQ